MITADEDKLYSEKSFIDVIRKAYSTHVINRVAIEYLWNYYKGKQPILDRQKIVRPDINNKIVENRAYEIVSFKTGYLIGEPIQYISRGIERDKSREVGLLNEMMFSENKSSKDKELVDWQHICGTAYRMVLPDPVGMVDDAPFEIYTLDPRDTFVIYSNGIDKKPIAGVTYYKDDDNVERMTVYTANKFIELEDFIIKRVENHSLKMIPIIEYPANNARLGSFEIVILLLDQLNNIASNRMDGMEQQIQSFIKFINCDIDETDYEAFLKKGAIKVKSTDGVNADVDVVEVKLNQTDSQVMANNTYQTVLNICGMPNRNGGNSTSDTGLAVEMRDGWSTAEVRAKDSEEMFKKSEQEMLKLVLHICRTKGELTLRLKDVGIQFTRRNYENIQSKSQVLTTMLNNEKIHPLLAFTHSGLFTDPEKAYSMSIEYMAGKPEIADENKTQQIENDRQGSL